MPKVTLNFFICVCHSNDDDDVPPCCLLCDAGDVAHSFVCAKQAFYQLRNILILYIVGVFLHLSIEGCQNKSFFKFSLHMFFIKVKRKWGNSGGQICVKL